MPDTYKLFSSAAGIAVAKNDKVIMAGRGGCRTANVDSIVVSISGQEMTLQCDEITQVNGAVVASDSASVLAAIATGLGFSFA
jgi:hypothetical protein